MMKRIWNKAKLVSKLLVVGTSRTSRTRRFLLRVMKVQQNFRLLSVSNKTSQTGPNQSRGSCQLFKINVYWQQNVMKIKTS